MQPWRHRLRLIRAATRQALRYPLRSLLVAGCAAIGVAGALTAVNYAAAGREQVLAQIQRLGTNVVSVSAQQSRSVAGRARTGTIVTTLREADYLALRRAVPDIVRGSAVAATSLRIKAAGRSKVARIVGVEPDWFAIRDWSAAQGRLLDDLDERRVARVAVVGAALAHDLFADESPLGERLLVNRVPFEIVGVLRERGPGIDAVDEDQQVYVPLNAAMRRVMNIDYYSALLLEIRDWQSMDRTARAVDEMLRERHRAFVRQDEDFKVQSQKTLVDTQLRAQAQLGFFVRWIGFTALLVSGLGVLAMSWIAVRARTREIGTRRALGATRADVFVQFAWESMALATVGATVGLVIGWVLSRVIAARAGLPFVFQADTAVLALVIAMVVNVLCASWPALRAARLDPIRALRQE